MANAWLIPILPLTAFIILAVLGKRASIRAVYLAIAAIAASFLVSLSVIIDYLRTGESYNLTLNWIEVGRFVITVGMKIDPLTCVMLFVVTLVALLVQVYSLGYMAGDKRFNWYFACLSLFSASMLGLVIANSFLLLYFCWELVGLCSYLLIGFWWERPQAAAAAKKAFIITRLGDVGFLIGLIYLYFNAGSLDMDTVFAAGLAPKVATIAALLLFVGAAGKSAQVPLHVWLPDAMEGPTPVSALIHAATMVAAGVYLVARSYPLFLLSEGKIALEVVAYVGAITALVAATIALTMRDIKRILAYSTISQLGYMMLALGVGGYIAGVFHLMTHAFFKALLFLAAGSAIHATHTNDIFEMGGLVKKMKVTVVTFILGALSLSGFPLMAGFFSKDEILAEAYHSGHYLIFGIALFTAFLTAFYMFRLCFVAFFGELKKEVHEPYLSMRIPLAVLAFLAVTAGWVAFPSVANFAVFMGEAHAHEFDWAVMGSSIGVAFIGIYLAWGIYIKGWTTEEAIIGRFGALYRFVQNKYYFDHGYEFLFEKLMLPLTKLSSFFDRGLINRAYDIAARLIRGSGQGLRYTATGKTQDYVLIALLGLIIIFVCLILGMPGSSVISGG